MKLLKMGSTPSRGSVKSIHIASENSQEIVNSRPSSTYSGRSTSAYSRHDSRPNSNMSNNHTKIVHQNDRTGSSKSRSSQYSSPVVMYGKKTSFQHELPGGLINSVEPQHQSPVQVRQMLEELERLKEKLASTEQRAEDHKEEAQELQELVLQKEDEICSLSLELEELKEHGVRIQEEKYQQTISAKDQYIRKLEEDLIRVKEDAAKECLQWEKKAKKARKVSATSRQDTALKLFELKDENAKLVEEKAKLKERLDRASAGSSRCHCGTSENTQTDQMDNRSDDDGRTKLILNLSQQVSTLDQENAKLKRELKECKKSIEKLHKNRVRDKHSTLSVTTNTETLPSLNDFKTNTEKTVVVNPVS